MKKRTRSIMATRRRSKTRTGGPSSRRRSAAWTRSPGMVMGWGRWTCKCVDDDEPRVDGVCGSVNAARALRLRAGFAASVFDAWLLPSLVHKHPYKGIVH